MTGRAAIDTNLLLLLIVGSVRRDFISRHKRLKGYTEADFEVLGSALRRVEVVVTTPNALTEVSNLLVQGVTDPLRTQFLHAFANLVGTMDERFNPSRASVIDPAFTRIGLSDATWLCLLDRDVPLLTDDDALYWQAIGRGLAALRLADLRKLALGT